jgi:aspartate aminotransferase-like enzyme
MHDRLYRKGFTIYPGKGAAQATFRLANMGNVCADDMRAFLSALTETIDEMGIRPLYSHD